MNSIAALLLFALLQQPGTVQKPAAGQPCTGPALVGTWQLFEWGGKPWPSSQPTAYKHVTPTHFFVVAVDAEGLAAYGHGGPYELAAGGKYTESIVHGFGNPFSSLRGTKVTFECSVEGEVWHNVGQIGDQTFDERWKRVKAGEGK